MTSITIKYFGMLQETVGHSEEAIDFTQENLVEPVTIRELIKILYTLHPALKDKEFKVAQNQELVSDEEKISGKEIALLPPFSGG